MEELDDVGAVATRVREALTVGAMGALVGAGVLLFFNVWGLEVLAPASNIPFVLKPSIDLKYLLRMVVIGALGAAIFALYPARRAANLRPVEALAGQ